MLTWTPHAYMDPSCLHRPLFPHAYIDLFSSVYAPSVVDASHSLRPFHHLLSFIPSSYTFPHTLRHFARHVLHGLRYVHTHTHMYLHTHTCMYIYTHTHICVSTHTHTHTHIPDMLIVAVTVIIFVLQKRLWARRRRNSAEHAGIALGLV
jgi:hypothetical protein